MEEVVWLVNELSSVDVSETPNNTNAPYPFAALYKSSSRKCGQEQRRQELLNLRKQCRQTAQDFGRAIPQKLEKIRSKPRELCYKNMLMYSEWLVDVPEDLMNNWCVLPCPEGNRRLVVAENGVTTCYNKAGRSQSIFPSELPGGNYGARSDQQTILDCVWNSRAKAYFVLDVINWDQLPLSNCDAEFRFFWLKSKFNENPILSKKTKRNRHPFYLLPNYVCEFDRLVSLASTYPFTFDTTEKTDESEKTNDSMELCEDRGVAPSLDGFLFYHLQSGYEPGHSPLIGWLKAYMLPDILGVPVNEKFSNEKPSDYSTLTQHIEDSKKKDKNWWSKKGKGQKEKMEMESEK